MNLILTIILIATAFLSFIPVVRMNNANEDHRYRCLKYLVNTAFIWTIAIVLERLITVPIIIYYIHMIGFPIKFLIASFMVCTIFNYIDLKIPKPLFILFIIGFIGEIIIMITNTLSGLLLDIST